MSLYRYARNPRKARIAQVLFARQQGRCQLCLCVDKPLEIDHIDGNPRNDAYPNLRLLCHRCNIAERNRQHSKSVSVKTPDATFQLHSNVDYSAGSPEMKVNEQVEVEFRNWAQAKVRLDTVVDKDTLESDLIDGGAELMGCSIATTTRHLRKLTSSEGPLRRYKNEFRKWVVKAKPGRNYDPGRGGFVLPPPSKLTLMKDGEPYKEKDD